MAITKKARENAYIGLYKAVGKYVELQGGRAPGRQDGRMSSKRGAVSGPSPHHPKSLP